MKPFQAQTYYELLEIPVSASGDDIRIAYERLCEQYSDDQVALYGLVEADHATALRARLLEAMEILSDDDLRGEYDKDLGLPPRELDDEDDEEQEEDDDSSHQLSMTDLLQVADSTAPRVSFEYVDRPVDTARFTPPPSSVRVEPLPEMTPPPPAPPPSASVAAPPVPSAPAVTVAVAADASPPSSPVVEATPAVSAPRFDIEIAPASAPRPVPPPPGAEVQVVVPLVEPIKPPAASAPEVAESSALALSDSTGKKPRESRPTEPPRPRIPDIAPDAEYNGELLRTVREALGLSLQQLADKTRIGKTHLECIEADRYGGLPVTVYLRGMLMSLSRELQLDGLKVSKSYLSLVERQKSKG